MMSPEEKKERQRVASRKYHDKNKEKRAAQSAEYRKNNPERVKENNVQYYNNNKDREKKRSNDYYLNNKEIVLAKNKKRNSKKNDWRKKNHVKIISNGGYPASYKINNSVRAGVYESLKGSQNGKKWQELVGYSLNDLEKRLKKTLIDLNKISAVKWEFKNYGKLLHIDHIIPLSSFMFESAKDNEFLRAWELKNLRLWPAQDFESKNRDIIQGNISKHAKCENFQMSMDQFTGVA